MTMLLKAKNYSDFSKGNWQSVASSIVPENSVKVALNMNSDVVQGELISRDGTTLIGSQIVINKPVLGLHNYRSALGSPDMIFAVVSDGTNSDIYDVTTGAKSLEDDTKDLKTHFLTYLDSCLRLNGTDGAKAWTGIEWITTGGAFDLANLPTGSKFAIEFKDQVYVAGRSDSPDRVDHSAIADSTTRTVSWTVGDTLGHFLVEQEDGGGGITGLAKVPGYVIIFKRRTFKRYDGSSTFPEDLVKQGAPSQECIVMSRGLVFWMNENDAWASEGGAPISIGSFMVRNIIKSISAADLLNVAGGTDEEHVFWSIPSCTISGETYTNVVLKYNYSQQTWDIRKYPTFPMCFERTVASDDEFYLTFGDNNGNVQIFDFGNTDNGTDINWAVETQDWSFGLKLFKKGISRMGVITENVSHGSLLWRTSHNPEDWKPLGTIDEEVKDIKDMSLEGNFFNFKLTGTTDSGKVKVLGFEFPAGIEVYDSSK